MQLILGLSDNFRPSAELVVQAFKNNGIESVMLTGDNEGSAQMIASQIGITRWISVMTPSGKYEWIEQEKVLYGILVVPSCLVY